MKLVKWMCVAAGTLLAGQTLARVAPHAVISHATGAHQVVLAPYDTPAPLRSGPSMVLPDVPAGARQALRGAFGPASAKAGGSTGVAMPGSSPTH